MNKIIKNQITKLRPSATLAINEESNKLIRSGKKVYKFGFGQSPFPISSKFLQINPEGLFGELIKSKIFLFLILFILFSN